MCLRQKRADGDDDGADADGADGADGDDGANHGQKLLCFYRHSAAVSGQIGTFQGRPGYSLRSRIQGLQLKLLPRGAPKEASFHERDLYESLPCMVK